MMSTKRKLPGKLGQPQIKQSAKVLGKGTLDDTKTVVLSGGNGFKQLSNGAPEIVDISRDSSSGSEVDSDDEEEADVAMEDAALPEEGEEAAEPSFGDLVRANATDPIDVAGAFEDQALTYPQGTQIQAPSGASLGTVLTQALKTNDVALLESCLQTLDLNTIRSTIQRLDSPLAGILLQKLAERLHRRPGRAGSLMVWVQWTLVTHGGYLATQRDRMEQLVQLNRVIDERAKGLPSLLSLKGKLDMLQAQAELRRSMQRRQVEDDEDDQGVIYVEGEESEEDAEARTVVVNGAFEDYSGSEVSEDMPITNGVIVDSEDDDESGEDGLLDDEAEETDADSGEEDEVDFDDQDSEGEDAESDDDAAPPSKMQKIGGTTRKQR